MANILITGGSGRLGAAIRSVVRCYAPSHAEMDISDQGKCCRIVREYRPDVIIHCAGWANSLTAETQRDQCWALNVQGARHAVRAAMGHRFVYISTDYVFDGERGGYSEGDTPNPVNFYGLSKLAGEQVVSQYPNTLILRAPFRQDPPWRFNGAFVDQWTSCDFVSVRAAQIVKAALSDITGILHIGGERRSIYEMASSVSEVQPIHRADFPDVKLPKDTSLNSEIWRSYNAA